MTFTGDERRAWLKYDRHPRRTATPSPGTVAGVCLHCSNPFVHGQGVVTEDAAICDICLGD